MDKGILYHHYLKTGIIHRATSVHSRWMFVCFVPSSAICWLSEHHAPCCGKWGTSAVTTLNYCNTELRYDKATKCMLNSHTTVCLSFLKCIKSSTEAFRACKLHQTISQGMKRWLHFFQYILGKSLTKCGHLGLQTVQHVLVNSLFTKQHLCFLRFTPGALTCFSFFCYIEWFRYLCVVCALCI